MLHSRQEIKAQAKAAIRGHIGMLFLCWLIMGLITGTGIGGILPPALAVSMNMIYIGLLHGKPVDLGDLFKRFDIFGRALWLHILMGFFTMLWSLLFFIPGIIKMYAYSMAPYILAEHPEMTAREALRESIRMTEGYKMELFVLQLSFIGWALLGVLTFGLLYIWLYPYIYATTAGFYLELSASMPSQPGEIPDGSV
jgi:uncharacterized membrane protein